ncbi:hypothetical protein L284_12055 [Novosphingobium lindaniclasticum LE124]|uniref:Major facilitator superfamily (MFS) profile domain-containing protein n=1 Tax=Novosphingobium lindaniclasticum LE124 TaxID=1096930 RepID=T0J0C4_9SPHN|nr:hypothetical protein L284_12055 [Novosphingobium lindaniclasticum LE124]
MLSPEAHVTSERREAGLRQLVVEAAFSNTTAALTTGVILPALALHLGASNVMIGLLAAVPFFAQFGQLPGIWLVERLRARKRIAVISSVVGRLALAVIAVLPFLAAGALPLLVLATAVLCLFGAVGGCAWNAWLRDLVPEERMGDLFARRTVYATITLLAAGLIAAGGLELSERGLVSADVTFAVLYGTGCLFGMLSAVIVARMPEPAMTAPQETHLNLFKVLRRPFRDPNFSRLIVFVAAWQFAINFATPFFTVFLVKQLGYGMTVVIGLNIASQLANALTLRQWGRLTDTFSNKSVLRVSAPVYILCIVGMTGASQIDGEGARLVWLTVLHLLMGGAMGGATLAVTNIALKLSPRGESTAYIAVNSLVSAIAAGVAPILGGLLADFFSARRLELALRWINPDGVTGLIDVRLMHWDFYFLISGALGVYALHRLSVVREEGEIDRSEVVRHMFVRTRSTFQNFSTVTGLRAITELPAGLAREERVRRRWTRMNARRLPVV